MNENDQKLPGRLIAVEGLDGSGKSTQIYLIKRWLEIAQYKVYFTEWNSSPLTPPKRQDDSSGRFELRSLAGVHR